MSEQQPVPGRDEQADFDAADRQVIPASVRRAPKFASFVATGAIAGIVIGLLCGYLLPNSTGVGRGTVALLVASGFCVLGVVIGGVIAVAMDRGTPRELKAMKADEADGHAWYAPQAQADAPPATADATLAADEASRPSEPTTASAPDEPPADRQGEAR